MIMRMVTSKKNKARLNSTVSPWIKKRIEEIANTDDFSIISNAVSQVLSEFIARYDMLNTSESSERAFLVAESIRHTRIK